MHVQIIYRPGKSIVIGGGMRFHVPFPHAKKKPRLRSLFLNGQLISEGIDYTTWKLPRGQIKMLHTCGFRKHDVITLEYEVED